MYILLIIIMILEADDERGLCVSCWHACPEHRLGLTEPHVTVPSLDRPEGARIAAGPVGAPARLQPMGV